MPKKPQPKRPAKKLDQNKILVNIIWDSFVKGGSLTKAQGDKFKRR